MNALAALLLALGATIGSSPSSPPIPAGPAGAPALQGMPPAVTLPLEEALAELDRKNPTLEQARARAAEALGVVRQAAAPLLPALAARGSYVHNSAEAVFLRPTGVGTTFEKVYIQPLQAWNGGASLRVPLIVPDAWFSLSSSRDASLAAAAGADATRLTMRAALLQTAWLAWAGEEIVAASERAVASARAQAESARRQVQVGTGTPLSVYQAETSATRRESDLVQALSETSRARIAVGVLLGRSEPVRIAMPPPRPPDTFDIEGLARQALEQRPEVKAQALLVRAHEKQVSASFWQIAPQLSASGSAYAQNVPYPTGQKEGWQVTVDLTWTLYDGGYRYGKARQAEAQVEEAKAGDVQTRLQVVQEVQNSARDVEVARTRLGLARKERDTAGEAAASARRGFEEGVASSLDVLSANEVLFTAEVQVADAGARLGGALAALDRAVGRSP
jgi:outer membrane protein TolC